MRTSRSERERLAKGVDGVQSGKNNNKSRRTAPGSPDEDVTDTEDDGNYSYRDWVDDDGSGSSGRRSNA